MGSVELRELRVFLALAEELHFGRTAERLGLTAPRVSQTVAALERRVGGRLFDRTSRRVELTPRAERLRRTVAEPYAALLAVVNGTREPATGPRGEVRLGLFGPAAGGPRLPEIIAAFEGLHPRCPVRIDELSLADCLAALRRGEIDLLATRTVVDAPDLAIGPVLHVDERVLLVAADHPLATSGEASVEVLGDHPVARPVGWTPEMEATVIPLRTPAGRVVVRAVEVASMAATHAAVARGDIVHLSTASTRQYSNHPGVVAVRVPDAPPSPSFLVWRRDTRDERVAAFVGVAAAVLTGSPVGDAPVRDPAVRDDDRLELRDVRIFLVLAGELHFGRTAERLRLTASRVSQTVAALERRVGGRLFDRNSRRVELTGLGRDLLRDVSVPYAELVAAVAGVRAMDTHLRGVLRIGLLGPASGTTRLFDIVKGFEARHPDCRVRTGEVALGEGLEPLRRGAVDLLVSYVSCGAPDLTVGPVLHRADRLLLVAADHPLAGRDEVSIEVLGDHEVAQCAGWTGPMADVVIPQATPAGRPIVRGLRIDSMAQLYDAVARGEIVHLSVSTLVDFSIHPGVAYVPVPDAEPLANVLTWRTTNEDPKIPAFVAVAEEILDAAPAR